MKLDVKSLLNKKVGQIELSDDVFGVEMREDILARVVNWQLAKRRSGNHKTKGISEIRGTTKKPWNQKGTGRARAGSLRAPQMRGGAIIFGPHVRDHSHKLPKKVRNLGLKVALSGKLKEGKLIVVDSLDLQSNKTKDAAVAFDNMSLKSALFVDTDSISEGFSNAIGNLYGFDALPQQGLNVYDILKKDVLVLTQSTVEQIEKRLK